MTVWIQMKKRMKTPTPAYKLVWATQEPTSRDPKVTLHSHYFAFLCSLTFDPKWFVRHPQIYSEDDIKQFDANFQKQRSFNLCATHATRKKSASLHEARASQLCDVDLDIVPTAFSRDTTDCQDQHMSYFRSLPHWSLIYPRQCTDGEQEIHWAMLRHFFELMSPKAFMTDSIQHCLHVLLKLSPAYFLERFAHWWF